MRQSRTYQLNSRIVAGDFPEFDTVIYLNSNGTGTDRLALGKVSSFRSDQAHGALDTLHEATRNINDWLFGYLSYDLKNEIEELNSENHDGLDFPCLHFWQPQLVFEWDDKHLHVHWTGLDVEQVETITQQLISNTLSSAPQQPGISLTPRITREEYLEKIATIKQHILLGDVYELNFCQEFFAENVSILPWEIYQLLNSETLAPYSTFLRDGSRSVMSASPEMYLRKSGQTLESSPIKGTARRGQTEEEDRLILEELRNHPKEQAENVMIVDLVRNDLSRIAQPGTVSVPGLMEVKSFKTVHQMVSTVSCTLRPDKNFTDIVKATFPMGSMTGAPKISAMKLSEKYESTRRGLYSGCIGFFTPDGDFTFNVVIRTLQYNADNRYLSLMTGGAITHLADPQQEYNESLLKAEAILRILSN